MNPQQYCLSWYRNEPVARIRYPKWWQVWKRAELYYGEQQVRHVIVGIPEDEKELILRHHPYGEQSDALGRLLLRMMRPPVQHLQLEVMAMDVGYSSNYISTSTGYEVPPSAARFQGKR